jgi:tight adherence protein C
MTPEFALLGLGAVALMLMALLLMRISAREQKVRERIVAIQRSTGVDQVMARRSVGGSLVGVIGRLGNWLVSSRALSPKTVTELEATLKTSGFRGDRALGVFIGSKVLSLVGLPLVVYLLRDQLPFEENLQLLMIAAAAILGLLLPEMIIKRLRKGYVTKLERGLPDALDMMIICAEAGLGLETAIDRVAEEIVGAHPEVANEFALTSTELKILAERKTALMNMGERTGLEELKRFGSTLVQTLQYGTPLVQALRTLANEMRQEQLIRFEERAARLPVLLTVPMIVFILPTLFLVVAGPAAIRALGL